MRTLADLFERGLTRERKRHFIWKAADGTVQAWSTAEIRDHVKSLATAMAARGLVKGDRVALLSRNSPRWAVTDYAIVTSGLVTVPLYPTLAPDQVRFILDDSGARGLFLEDRKQFDRLREALDGSALEWIVVMSDEAVPDERAHLWMPFAESGRGSLEPKGSVAPADLASIIYTSGTTGKPKGVMLTHANLVSNALACDEAIDLSGVNHINMSLLPLSHIFQRLVDYLLFMQHATMIHVAEPQEAIGLMKELQPTFFAAVPRIFEKVHAAMRSKIDKGSPLSRRLAYWAIEMGRRRFHAVYREGACDGKAGMFLKLKHVIADALVLRKLRAAFGGSVDVCFSGGGPLTFELHEFYRAIGIKLLPGYGLTETSPVLTTNRRSHMRLGSVGPAVPGVDLKVAADGELLAAGPNIMQGYWRRPEETADAIRDGWLHTGDLARIDGQGFVFITGRKKEILVLTTGKKVAPAMVEEHIARSPLVAQSILVGDERKFIAALIWPNVDALKAEMSRRGLETKGSVAELLARTDTRRVVQESVDAACAGLAEFERPKTIALLPRELTIADGDLTPTLKMKRKVVVETFSPLIDQCFRGPRE